MHFLNLQMQRRYYIALYFPGLETVTRLSLILNYKYTYSLLLDR